MAYFEILLTVCLVWAFAAVTPGPNFFITVHTALRCSQDLSLYTVLGIITGTFVWATSGFLGISILINMVPIAYSTIKAMGAAYLIYIGLKLLIFKNTNRNNDQNLHKPGKLSNFNLGLYTNLLNPKTATFISSLFATTIPENTSANFGIICILCICLISGVWYSLVAKVASAKKTRKTFDRSKEKIEKITGAVLISFGIKLLTTEQAK